MGNGHNLYPHGKRIYVYDHNHRFAHAICFELEREQYNECRMECQVLQETIEKLGVPEIFNTDQGSQYTSEVHTNLLLSNKIKISMDGEGLAIDKIFIERLWRTVIY